MGENTVPARSVLDHILIWAESILQINLPVSWGNLSKSLFLTTTETWAVSFCSLGLSWDWEPGMMGASRPRAVAGASSTQGNVLHFRFGNKLIQQTCNWNTYHCEVLCKICRGKGEWESPWQNGVGGCRKCLELSQYTAEQMYVCQRSHNALKVVKLGCGFTKGCSPWLGMPRDVRTGCSFFIFLN